jgi:hypothetical protein
MTQPGVFQIGQHDLFEGRLAHVPARVEHGRRPAHAHQQSGLTVRVAGADDGSVRAGPRCGALHTDEDLVRCQQLIDVLGYLDSRRREDDDEVTHPFEVAQDMG